MIPKYKTGDRVWVSLHNQDGCVLEVLRADSTYWYKIALDNGRTVATGETWVYRSCEHRIQGAPCDAWGQVCAARATEGVGE